MKTISTVLALLLIVAIGNAQDTIQTPYTKYLIVSESEYVEINEQVSVAKGYDLYMQTERVWDIIPNMFCYNKDSVFCMIIRVNPENQAFIDTSLLVQINDFVLVDSILLELDLILKPKVKKWFEKQYAKAGDKKVKIKYKNK
jgi:hypothetical protein